MVWPFKRKSTGVPSNLVFKNSQAFFEYQCKFGVTGIQLRHAIVGIVGNIRGYQNEMLASVGARQVAGREPREPDGTQSLVATIVSEDGGFATISRTASAGGPYLREGDLVLWVPIARDEELASLVGHPRGAWVGLVVAKIGVTLKSDGWDIQHEWRLAG